MNQVRIERAGWDKFNVFYYNVFFGTAYRETLVQCVQNAVGINNVDENRDAIVQEFADRSSYDNRVVLEVSR